MQFTRWRYYSPGVGRWTQVDPIVSPGGPWLLRNGAWTLALLATHVDSLSRSVPSRASRDTLLAGVFLPRIGPGSAELNFDARIFLSAHTLYTYARNQSPVVTDPTGLSPNSDFKDCIEWCDQKTLDCLSLGAVGGLCMMKQGAPLTPQRMLGLGILCEMGWMLCRLSCYSEWSDRYGRPPLPPVSSEPDVTDK